MSDIETTGPIEGIAIIGMAGRFPGAGDLQGFWQNLRNGVETIRFFSDEELRAAGVSPADLADPRYVRAGTLLEDAETFDAAFFGVTPRDAEIMDPQHRVFLECAWEALENAGYDSERYAGAVGVFGGAGLNTYLLNNLHGNQYLLEAVGPYQMMLLNDKDYLTTRVSYKLNLKGPSVVVQTACSTSLVAVHHACQSLLNYQCDIALAGGVAVHAPQVKGYRYQDGMILSPDGHCRPFDAQAAGTIGGTGVGIVVLKRLADALADGDTIDAVIRGTAINNDGALKVGYTAPSVEGQAEVIAMAQAVAGVEPETISYVEAHGTGTPLGDPIEIAGLTQAFRLGTQKQGFCAIGSVKASIGHPDAAAGIAGLIKTVLSLQHRQIPPSLHFTQPNPKIAFEGSPFYVNAGLQDWKSGETPRRAGVSSFGIGGTNAHAVVEEAPSVPVSSEARPDQLLLLSAKTPTALETMTQKLAAHLRQNPGLNLPDAAYTLQTGRRAFAHRRMLVCKSAEDGALALETQDTHRVFSHSRPQANPSVAFLFPGQGAQHVHMGLDLYQTEPVFREEVDACAEILKPILGLDLRDLLYPDKGQGESAQERINQTWIAQPALFVMEYALARCWMAWGIHPRALLGHSVGEYVAACLSGVFSREDALKLLAARGRLMQSLPTGAMFAVRLAAESLPPLPSELSLAAINSPTLSVVSGPENAIVAFAEQMEARGVAGKRLHTSHAFHSAMMEPILAEFTALVKSVRRNAPQIPYLSNVTGQWITPEQATDPEYWATHLRQTVRFADGVRELANDAECILLEVGPGQTLSTLAKQCLSGEIERLVLASAGASRTPGQEGTALLTALGRLWMAGVAVDWNGFYANERRQRVHLPTYPFERKRYWVDPPKLHKVEAVPEAALSEDRPVLPVAGSTLPATENKGNIMPDPTPLARTPRRERIYSEVAEVLNHVGGIGPADMDRHAHFLEMGFDSLLLVQLSQALRRRFDVNLSVVQLLEDLATADALTSWLDENLPPDPVEITPPSNGNGNGHHAKQTAQLPALAPPASLPVSAPAPSLLPDAVWQTDAGNGAGAALPSSALERILSQQLQVMSQQLALLRAGSAPGPETPPPFVPGTPQSGRADASVVSSFAAPCPPSAAEPAALGPFRQVRKEKGNALTDRQQAYLNDFIARYNRRTAGSKAQAQADRQSLADPRAIVGFQRHWKELVYPIVAVHSQGAHIRDIDGNEYIDLVMGFGANLLGHAPALITDALQQQIAQGIEVGPQSRRAGQVARLLCELTGMERSALLNTGSEAVMTALRLARAVTGRNRVALFAGAYHGNFDGVLVRPKVTSGGQRPLPVAAGTPPGMIEDTLVLEYGSPESLEILRREMPNLAAVLVEPIQSRLPELQPRAFLHELRALTQEAGTALIFDEMVTGFRIELGGAQSFFDVKADIATYGKIVGGGMPIGVIAGAARFLDAIDGGAWQYGDDSFPQADLTFYAGTFCKHPLTVAAAHALLTHLKTSGPQLQTDLNWRTAQLAATLNAWFVQKGVPVEVVHCGSLFKFRFGSEVTHSGLFCYHLMLNGVHLWEGRNAFLSTAHSDEDIARIIGAVQTSVEAMQSGGFLPESPRPSDSGSREAPRHEPADLTHAVVALPNDTPRVFPLTEAQQEIWVSSQRGAEASCSYNEAFQLHLRGGVNAAALRCALQGVVDRHEALRITFDANGENQTAHPALTVELPLVDLFALNAEEQSARLAALLENETQQPFDLENGPLFRAQLVQKALNEWLFVFTAHHIVFDGWSSVVLFQELSALYAAACAGTRAELPEPVPYSSYVREVQTGEAKAARAASEQYWQQMYAQPAPVLALPTDRPRTPQTAYDSALETRTLSPALYAALKKAGGQQRATLFHLLFAGYNALLNRLTGQNEFVVGMVVAGQTEWGDRPLMGHCASLLPLRTYCDAARPFAEMLTAVRRSCLEAYQHPHCSFSSLPRAPYVGALFNLDQAGSMNGFAGLEARLAGNPKRFTTFDLWFNILQSDGELKLACIYKSALFDPATIRRWMDDYETLLGNIAGHPEQSVSELGAHIAERTPASAASGKAAAPEFVPPRTTTEEELARLWREVLSLETIGVHDDFFAAGGHSMLIVRLVTRIRQTFGKEIPLTALFQNATIAGMAALLSQETPSDSISTLHAIHAGGSRRPLFCAVIPNENPLGYVALTRHLGGNRPVYALQGQYRDDIEVPFTQTDYEILAADYIRAMRSAQPEGPYLLAGMCSGAHIAFEMARQLYREKQEVALLAVIDTWVLENTSYRALWNLSYYMRRVRAFWKMPAAQKRALAHKVLRRAARIGTQSLGSGKPAATAEGTAFTNAWAACYWPGPSFEQTTYAGKVTLLRVRHQPFWRHRLPHMGWGTRALGGVEIHQIPGDHVTLFREPHVQGMARVLNACLEEVEGRATRAVDEPIAECLVALR